jgi:uroporphyrinogen-III synthase
MQGLSGRQILITRSAEQSRVFAERIQKSGGVPVFFPTIKIGPLENYSNFDNALLYSTFDWIIFTSTNTVDFFFKRASKLNVKIESSKIAAVGNKTAKRLEKYSTKVDLLPKEFTSKALAQMFKKEKILDKKILIPASSLAKNELRISLEEMGAIVETFVVYKVLYESPSSVEQVKNKLLNGDISCITFFSPSSIKGFTQLMGKNIVDTLNNKGVAVAVIGPTTKAAATKNGFSVNILPDKSEQESLMKSIIHFFNMM